MTKENIEKDLKKIQSEIENTIEVGQKLQSEREYAYTCGMYEGRLLIIQMEIKNILQDLNRSK